MRDYFCELAERLCAGIAGDELLLLDLAGEDSDFVRVNRGRVRQAGRVGQQRLGLRLVRDGRQARADLDLALDRATDLERAGRLLRRLRDYCAHLPVDPYLQVNREPRDSESVETGDLPPAGELAGEILAGAGDLDLVGILASGGVFRGFANSLGQRNWHRRELYHFDFSIYVGDDRAVKSSLAGPRWQSGDWSRRLAELAPQLGILRQPRRRLAPGDYRVYLAPAALLELTDLLAWGGFGLKSLKTAQTPLLQLVEGDARLSPEVGLREDLAQGLAPAFSTSGFVLPPRVALVEAGRHAGSLVDERSAAEYGVAVNAATEAPSALAMDGGAIDAEQVLAGLGTGLYINNLWYCNYADRNTCRMTGMTRFASFWVEDGRLQAPAEVMRFDDSLYRILGDALLGLTRETELIVDAGSYGGRNLRCATLPGALIERMHFPL